MRIVNMEDGSQIVGLSLYVTRKEASDFLNELQKLDAAPPGPGSRLDLVDNGDQMQQASYRTRSMVLFKIDPENLDAQGWSPDVLTLISDYAAEVTHVSLALPEAEGQV